MHFTHIRLTITDSIATLVLDHPGVMNAISIEMLNGFGQALDAIEERRDEITSIDPVAI